MIYKIFSSDGLLFYCSISGVLRQIPPEDDAMHGFNDLRGVTILIRRESNGMTSFLSLIESPSI